MIKTGKLAFLGGGINSAVGYTHVVASQLDGQFTVVAGAFSRDAATNARSGQLYGLGSDQVYPGLGPLLEARAEELDALVVLTPTPDHHRDVQEALKRGVSVICEKALTTDSHSAWAIARKAREARRHCLVTFNYTGYPAVREMRRQIQQGLIGDLIQIAIEMPQESFLRAGAAPQDWRLRDYQLPTVSLDLGVHVVHLADYLATPGHATKVVASQQHGGTVTTVIDNVNSIVEYDSGAVASFWWSKTALGHRNGLRVRIFGSERSLEWCQMSPEDVVIAARDGTRTILDRGAPSPDSELARVRYNRFKAGHPAGFIEAFANLYRDFRELLATPVSAHDDDNDNSFSAEKAAQGIELLEHIHRRACDD